MTGPGSLAWFARHECRLVWRDFAGMVSAGRPARARIIAVLVLGLAAFLHLVAHGAMLGSGPVSTGDKATLVMFGGTGAMILALMLSQALESVTRAFYARADLDLILASPAPAAALFAIRTGAVALAGALMAGLLAGPFIDALAWTHGAHWLSAYLVLFAFGAASTGIAVGVTVGLFRLIGPKRTRTVAQVIAAIVGASFVIIIQVASILLYGQISRVAALRSSDTIAAAPDPGSLLWWPVRAAAGEPLPLAAVVAAGLAILCLSVLLFAPKFGDYAVAAGATASAGPVARERPLRPQRSPAAALRRKEWVLIGRDPWLLSQTLMQILYLVPPALLLWRNFGSGSSALLVLVPVLVMAAGQLAGGLAWLTISGEDAPDLVATAPVSAGRVTLAKVEAVLVAVGAVVGPFLVAMMTVSGWHTLVAASGCAAAAGAATLIQFIFRTRARRSQFRRRQTASRLATFAEAFSSIAWAATAALAALGTWLAAGAAAVALAVLGIAWLLGPGRNA
ncbi:permease [Prosthecomicrobium sp. N25]|uniref:permease n=1 Tax=Prosthecomicrobium sp. N25 TaxID=3129254 RepID=UPI00307745F5